MKFSVKCSDYVSFCCDLYSFKGKGNVRGVIVEIMLGDRTPLCGTLVLIYLSF